MCYGDCLSQKEFGKIKIRVFTASNQHIPVKNTLGQNAILSCVFELILCSLLVCLVTVVYNKVLIIQPNTAI